jgi:hypothetical protein
MVYFFWVCIVFIMFKQNNHLFRINILKDAKDLVASYWQDKSLWFYFTLYQFYVYVFFYWAQNFFKDFPPLCICIFLLTWSCGLLCVLNGSQ